ncbi:hypothetical protein [Pontibacillus marinus]|uniref:DUF5668 domain-containing protein n=1 Tax=Pontibacillus marinus BH030004 = DSM 16465 TaxID=1385511 RepID=A0A0A5GGT2_9BACI|nr:hypothetical protein [Pontibacillus marinus]KGX90325.1 hypothetical protein N783_21275 [Pontibacillus marinus BH030004 = DSM 16465]
MRKWRVGTVSMGLSLIMLGIMLMVSQISGWDVMNLALSWWPAILIVLGIEILLYLFFSKQEKPMIQYDFLSIIFIGVIGTVAIGFYIVSSFGIVEEVKASMNADRIEGALPHVEEEVKESVNKIVVQPTYSELTIETNNERQVHLFGTFQSNFLEKEALNQEDVVNFTRTGDTLFIQLMEPPKQEGFRYGSTHYKRTLSLPENVKVEIREGAGSLNINIGTIQADWMIDQTHNAVVQIDEEADVVVKVEGRDNRLGWDVAWDSTEVIQGEVEHQKLYYKEKQYGEGSNTLQFNLVDEFTIKSVGSRS